MKKQSIVLAACLALFTGAASAQGKLEAGIQAGPGMTVLWGNEVIKGSHDVALSLPAGLFVQYNFSERFALRVDPGFERKGSLIKTKLMDPQGNISESVTRVGFDYLVLPVLVRATFGQKQKFFVNAGPYVAFLLDYNHSSKRNVNLPPPALGDISYYKQTDFGVSLGVGTLIPLTEKLGLSVEVRNNLGLQNISNKPVVNDGTINTYSANLLVGAAYKL